MQLRDLGTTGIKIAPIVLGGNVFGWTADEQMSFALLDAFVDAGYNMIDTADVYSRWAPGHRGGESETVLGRWFARSGKRDRVILATKVGMEMAPGDAGLARPRILRSAEDSLRRLQTDYIDLYQSHQDDPNVPIAETLEAYQDLIKAGKVRFIGASNYTAQRLSEALEISRAGSLPAYSVLQPLYNLYDRSDYEGELESVAQQHRLGVIPYYSLAAGFLTGKYRSMNDVEGKARAYWVKGYLNARGFRILQALDAVSKKCGAKPAQVALAWLLARPSITAPIASATNLEQLQKLLGAAEVQLDQADLVNLDHASAEFAAQAAAWESQN